MGCRSHDSLSITKCWPNYTSVIIFSKTKECMACVFLQSANCHSFMPANLMVTDSSSLLHQRSWTGRTRWNSNASKDHFHYSDISLIIHCPHRYTKEKIRGNKKSSIINSLLIAELHTVCSSLKVANIAAYKSKRKKIGLQHFMNLTQIPWWLRNTSRNTQSTKRYGHLHTTAKPEVVAWFGIEETLEGAVHQNKQCVSQWFGAKCASVVWQQCWMLWESSAADLSASSGGADREWRLFQQDRQQQQGSSLQTASESIHCHINRHGQWFTKVSTSAVLSTQLGPSAPCFVWRGCPGNTMQATEGCGGWGTGDRGEEGSLFQAQSQLFK